MERYTSHSEYISELKFLRNKLIAQLAEIDMELEREITAKSARTVTLETRHLLNQSQRVDRLWTSHK